MGRGLPPGFVLTLGKAQYEPAFATLFRMTTVQVEAFLTDRGYDVDTIREDIDAAGAKVVIPNKANQSNRVPL